MIGKTLVSLLGVAVLCAAAGCSSSNGTRSLSSDGGNGSDEASTTTDCPPCWNAWACLDNYESLDYFTGKRNPDGSCSLTVDSPNDGTVDITLECGHHTNQASSWANDMDPNGAPAIDFIESALVLHCDQT